MRTFDNLAACEAYLGGAPITSKLAMITKEKPDGSVKRRLILDCKESGVNSLATRGGRLLLPRPTDVVEDAMYMLWHNKEGGTLEAMVLDLCDWFHAAPQIEVLDGSLNSIVRKPCTLTKQLYLAFFSK